jgi:hypothetical protein
MKYTSLCVWCISVTSVLDKLKSLDLVIVIIQTNYYKREREVLSPFP